MRPSTDPGPGFPMFATSKVDRAYHSRLPCHSFLHMRSGYLSVGRGKFGSKVESVHMLVILARGIVAATHAYRIYEHP
jgi:hypothetical protein